MEFSRQPLAGGTNCQFQNFNFYSICCSMSFSLPSFISLSLRLQKQPDSNVMMYVAFNSLFRPRQLKSRDYKHNKMIDMCFSPRQAVSNTPGLCYRYVCDKLRQVLSAIERSACVCQKHTAHGFPCQQLAWRENCSVG